MVKTIKATGTKRKFESMNVPLNDYLWEEGEMRFVDMRKAINRKMSDIREVFIQNVLIKNHIMYSSTLSRQAKDIVFEAKKVAITKGEGYDFIYIGDEIVGMWKTEAIIKVNKRGLVLKVVYWSK